MTADGHRARGRLHRLRHRVQTNDFMFPMAVTGSGGRSLREEWADGAHAHLGMAIPGFPSMFVMYGPTSDRRHRRWWTR